MTTVNSFEALGAALKIRKRTPQKEWAAPRQEKFLKCPKCGAQMTYHVGTNVLTCDNMVETKGFNEDGAEYVKKEECGFVRFLDSDSVSYAEYLFS